jgi:hypothetical protein
MEKRVNSRMGVLFICDDYQIGNTVSVKIYLMVFYNIY